jgi:hypothetical protein
MRSGTIFAGGTTRCRNGNCISSKHLTNDRCRAAERCRALFIDRGDAKRRFEPAGRIDCDTLEGDEVRRADHDDSIDGPVSKLLVRKRGNRPRIHETSVRSNQPDDPVRRRRPFDGVEMPIDGIG